MRRKLLYEIRRRKILAYNGNYAKNIYIIGGAAMKQSFTVIIEQGEDGAYIASVSTLKSCYTQAATIPELLDKIKEVIELCLEVESDILQNIYVT